MEWILERFAESTFSMLIDTVLKGSLVGAALIAGTILIGGRRARLRSLLLNLGILALLAIPILSIFLNFPVKPLEAHSNGTPQMIEALAPSIPIPIAISHTSASILLLPVLYLLGILVLGSRVFASLYGLFRLNQTCSPIRNAALIDQLDRVRREIGIKRSVGLYSSARVESPCQMGILNPAVILPADLPFTPEAMDTILLHELVHIKRQDCLFKMLGSICLVVHWFNPLVWMVVRRSARVQDQVCDDWVVYLQKSPDHYVETLISVVRGFRTPEAFTYQLDMAQGSGLLERIRRIRELNGLSPKLGSAGLTVLVASGCVLLAMVCLLSVEIAPTEASGLAAETPAVQRSEIALDVQTSPGSELTVTPVAVVRTQTTLQMQKLVRPVVSPPDIPNPIEEPDAWFGSAVLALAGPIEPISPSKKMETLKISNDDVMLYPEPSSYADIAEVHKLTPPAGSTYQTSLTMGNVMGTMFYSRPFHTGETPSQREEEAQRLQDKLASTSGGTADRKRKK